MSHKDAPGYDRWYGDVNMHAITILPAQVYCFKCLVIVNEMSYFSAAKDVNS